MLVRLTGRLDAIESDAAIVTLPIGMTYRAMLPSSVSESLRARIGETITLETLELFEASGQGSHLTPRLIGFVTEADRRFFELFTTVKGVGSRKALRAMAAPTADIAAAISRKDTAFLRTLPEIGARMAETICAELGGKVDRFITPAFHDNIVEPKAGAATGGIAAQAIAALVRLGESRPDAERLVNLARQRDPAIDNADALLAAAFASRPG
jgi:Holliday junction DNA helicase RuvA